MEEKNLQNNENLSSEVRESEKSDQGNKKNEIKKENNQNNNNLKKSEKKHKKEKIKKSLAREIMEWIGCFLIAFVAAIIIKYFVFTPTLVKQGSMTPTILNGERVLISRFVRTFNQEIKRGDIITFEQPYDVDFENGVALYNDKDGIFYFIKHNLLEIGKISYIKRVIGIENDRVYISSDGSVYVNDEKIDETYLVEGLETPRTGKIYDITVPEGYVFAMGDNRKGSTDCRVFGCIPIDKIEGRVTFRIWPLNKFGKIDK